MLLFHLNTIHVTILTIVFTEEVYVEVLAVPTPTLLGEILALTTDPICFMNTANELGTLMIGATRSMVIQPTQEPQKEEVRDLQQMCTLLRMMDINVRKILSSEGKFH